MPIKLLSLLLLLFYPLQVHSMVNLRKGNGGLGPNSWGNFRWLIPYQCLFYEASITHDVGYTIGGSENDRLIVDSRFYRQTLGACSNCIERSFAKLYYKLVRKFGYLYFNYI